MRWRKGTPCARLAGGARAGPALDPGREMTEERAISLEVKELAGGYGRVPILHGVGIEMGEGEVVGILGHNGMGKSTLLKTLMGLLPAHAGSVRYYGSEITRLPANERARLGMGYVPQGRGIFPRLSVRENLEFVRQDHDRDDEGAALAALLADFPRLEPLLGRKGETLSGGEQQILALARCLMGDPGFLLLDEPTEGIQPSIVEDVARTLSKLRDSRGLSILLVEQNFDFIAELSDRVLVLERGRITGELARSELADRAKVDRYLGFGAARSLHPAGPLADGGTPAPRAPRAPARTSASGEPGPASPPPPGSTGVPPAHVRSAAATPAEPMPSARPALPAEVPRPRSAPLPRPASAATAPAHALAPGRPLPPPRHDLHPVSTMTIKRPALSQMRAMADRFGMRLSDAELDEFREIMEPYIQAYDRLDAAPDNLPEVR